MTSPKLRALAVALFALPFAAAAAPLPPLVQEAPDVGPRSHPGEWVSIPGVPIAPVHAANLKTGKVALYAFGDTTIWNPASGNFTRTFHSHTQVFCSGMALLADGRLVSAGGTRLFDGAMFWGLETAETLDANGIGWTQIKNMTGRPRWYPTAVTLSDGRVGVFGGVNGPKLTTEAEIYNPATDSWTRKGARALPLYVQAHLVPDGRVHFVGPMAETSFWRPDTGDWEPGPVRVGGDRGGGTSVVLDPSTGRTLALGGWTRSSEVFEPDAGVWRPSGEMHVGNRIWANAVLLPDGNVLAVGGETGQVPPGENGESRAIPAEVWDVATGAWVLAATPTSIHIYHSTALLLPDGSVVATNQLPAALEVYKPWYFFAGARPRIDVAPDVVAYGEPFPIVSPDAARVRTVELIRLGSVTHSLNTDQRVVKLDFVPDAVGAGAITASAPLLGTVAPPGYYLLFIVDDRGVPSEGKIVRLVPGLSTLPFLGR